MKSDAKLKSDVEAELDWEPSINANTIGVDVQSGVVTLAGHVSTYPQKLAAEQAAQRIEGVRALVVDLEVRLPGSVKPSDGEIAAAAADALRWNSLVPPDRIKLRVEDGGITLSGEVEWAYQKAAAETAVRHLLGVRSVQNAVQVKPSTQPENLRSKIEAALQRSAHCQSKSIRISVEGSRVILRGSTHSHHERRVAEEAAWAAPGVTEVVDQIVVES